MRLAASFFLVCAVLYWFSGAAMNHYLYPVIQPEYQYLLVNGATDFFAGFVAGMALAVIVRPSRRVVYAAPQNYHGGCY